MASILTTPPTAYTHPFTSPRPVAELEAYLLTLVDPAVASDEFWARTARAYARGIATFYAGHPSTAPACSLANVAATIQVGEMGRVLAMLATYPESRQLVQCMITAFEMGAQRQMAGVLTTLKQSLGYLAFDDAASAVDVFLLQFPPLRAGR